MKKIKSEVSKAPEFANTVAENLYWLKKYAEADGCWPPESNLLPVKLADTTSRVKRVANGFIITDDKSKQYVEHEGRKIAENLKQILIRKLQNMNVDESIDVRLVIYTEEHSTSKVISHQETAMKMIDEAIQTARPLSGCSAGMLDFICRD
jgi:hypothetical protein